jgi:CRP/FNR family transcriptional regulator, cyclic AMP receptor protein
METVELLRRVVIFQGLTDDELEKFAAISVEHAYPAEEIILEERVEGRALYIIERGTVAVSKVENETETEITKLVAGETFGEMSLIEGNKTSARVKAYNEVDCLLITKEDLFNLMDKNVRISAKVYKNFTRMLSERLRITSEELSTWKASM